MKSKITIIVLIVLLLISVFYNLKSDDLWYVNLTDANTRPTYDTFHHIKQAQKLATGRGVKVGIIGKYFGYKANKNIYAGGKNFTDNKDAFETIAEHGFWMATSLKEIAPNAQIYALNARDANRENETKAIVKAIDWAIENDLDILTYSAQAFTKANRSAIDKAVQKAATKGIVTTFIHYDLPDNIVPIGFFPKSPKSFNREADVNIFHFDYNLLLLFKYKNYLKSGRRLGNNIGDYPFFSNSSMSPVLAGIVAMMKEINNDLTPAVYKKILIETSYETEYNGYKVKHVVNAREALHYLLKMDKTKK